MAVTHYTDAEIDKVAGWLRLGMSANRIAREFSCTFGRPVSRNAVVGLVTRNKRLKAIGFARSVPGKRRPDAWTDEEVAVARDLWEQGADARRIGERVGRSAKAVAHYMASHREAFPIQEGARRETGRIGGMVSRLKRSACADRPVADFLTDQSVDALAYDGASRRLPLSELGWRDCRFAVNDAQPGEQHLFCGLPAEPGRPWCLHHLCRCTGEGTRGERDADQALMRARAA